MATAPPPPSPDTNISKHRTIITIASLIGILAVVILLAVYGKRQSPQQRLEELQLQNELQRSGYRRRQRRKEVQENAIAPSLLQYIPVVKYTVSSLGGRRTRSLDLEKGHSDGEAQKWSLAQSQLHIRAMKEEMSEIQGSGNVKERNTNSEKLQRDFEQQECPICTQSFIQDESVRILPCGHMHHMSCIDPWLLGFSGTCPVCRVHMDAFRLQPAEITNLPRKPEPAMVTRNNFGYDRY